jgi:hypothetical protein
MDYDRCEQNNLVSKYPERVKRMEKMYNDWAEKAYVNPPLNE